MIRPAALAFGLLASPLMAEEILSATYGGPTDRYPHGILGDEIEWSTLEIEVGRQLGNPSGLFSGKRSLTYRIELPQELVFEDTAPRLWDVTADGAPEVILVQSHQTLGARLLVLGLVEGKPEQIAEIPFIGQRNRWLAPIGAADLDGDGYIEIAYIDRPHLAKTLRVWRYIDGALEPVANLPGFTNHRIGEQDIAGGIRECENGPEMITASADWSRIIASTLNSGQLIARDIGRHDGRASFALALACESLPR